MDEIVYLTKKQLTCAIPTSLLWYTCQKIKQQIINIQTIMTWNTQFKENKILHPYRREVYSLVLLVNMSRSKNCDLSMGRTKFSTIVPWELINIWRKTSSSKEILFYVFILWNKNKHTNRGYLSRIWKHRSLRFLFFSCTYILLLTRFCFFDLVRTCIILIFSRSDGFIKDVYVAIGAGRPRNTIGGGNCRAGAVISKNVVSVACFFHFRCFCCICFPFHTSCFTFTICIVWCHLSFHNRWFYCICFPFVGEGVTDVCPHSFVCIVIYIVCIQIGRAVAHPSTILKHMLVYCTSGCPQTLTCITIWRKTISKQIIWRNQRRLCTHF